MGTIRVLVRRSDNKAPLAGAAVTLTAPLILTALTGADGLADITVNQAGVYMFQVSAAGFQGITSSVRVSDLTVITRAIPDIELSATVSTPPPLGVKEEVIMRIGTSCSIINNYNFSKSFYQVRHDRLGNLTSLGPDLPTARDAANRRPECFETPPPAPKTIGDIGADVSSLAGVVTDMNAKLDSLKQIVNNMPGGAQGPAGAPGPAGPAGPPGPPANNGLIIQETADRIADTGLIKRTIDGITSSVKTVQNDIKTGLAGVLFTIDSKILGLDTLLKAGLASIDSKIDIRFKPLETSLKTSLDGLWAKLESWLIDNFLRVLEKALDAEIMRKS